MQIKLTPMRADGALTLFRAGDVLSFNGEAFDFSDVSEGAILPRDAIDCAWIAGDVTRVDGALVVPVILPHGADAAEATRFPVPVEVGSDDPVDLPPYSESEVGL